MDPAQLNPLIHRWFEAQANGTPLTVEELTDCPEARRLLAQQLADLPKPNDTICLKDKLSSRETEDELSFSVDLPAPEQSDSAHDYGGGTCVIEPNEPIPEPKPTPPVVPLPAFPAIPGYTILEVLGVGASGTVYLAMQARLNRLVALKMLRCSNVSPEEGLRFLREAETAGRLSHPGIVQVHEFGHIAETPYFSLEYVEGGTLARKINNTPQDPQWSARLIIRLSEAIAIAHTASVIHRDLKPTNILLTLIGEPKISDFGLARSIDGSMTIDGSVLGTPSYMPPEQIKGKAANIGRAVDIYALGAILYECLTGRPPYKGATPLLTMGQVLDGKLVPPRQLNKLVPRDLEVICLKCLRHDLRDRYHSADDLADDLELFLADRPIKARPPRRLERLGNWIKREPGAAAAFALVSLMIPLVGLVIWFAARDRNAADQLDSANAKARAAEERQRLANEQARTARELASAQEFYTGLTRLGERSSRPVAGWSWPQLDDIRRLAQHPLAHEHLVELRTEAARCYGSLDIELVGVVGPVRSIHALAWHPRGKWFAIGERGALSSEYLEVALIDPKTRLMVRNFRTNAHHARKSFFERNPDIITSLAVTPDGRWLLAGTRFGWLHRWDISQPDPVADERKVLENSIEHLIVDSTGTHCYLHSRTVLESWSLTDLSKQADASFPSIEVGPLHIDASTGQVCGIFDRQLLFLDPTTLKPVGPGQKMPYSRLLPITHGLGVVVADDRTITLLGCPDCRTMGHFTDPNHDAASEGPITEIQLSPSGDRLLAISESARQATLWGVHSGRLLCRFPLQAGRIHAAFDPLERWVIFSSDLGAMFYNLRDEPIRTFAARQVEGIHRFAIDPAGGKVATLGLKSRESLEGNLSIWETIKATTATESRVIAGIHYTDADPICFDADGSRVRMYLSEPNRVQAFDSSTLAEGFMLPLDDACTHLERAPGGRLWLASGHEVLAWSSGRDGRVLARYKNVLGTEFTGKGELLSVLPGCNLTAVSGRDGAVRLLREDNELSLEAKTEVSPAPVRALAWLDGEKVLASGNDNGILQILSVPSLKVLAESKAHREQLEELHPWPGNRLISASRDGTVRIWQWNGSTLNEQYRLEFHRGIRAITPHPDGHRLIVLLHHERALRVWDLAGLEKRFAEMGLWQP